MNTNHCALQLHKVPSIADLCAHHKITVLSTDVFKTNQEKPNTMQNHLQTDEEAFDPWKISVCQ